MQKPPNASLAELVSYTHTSSLDDDAAARPWRASNPRRRRASPRRKKNFQSLAKAKTHLPLAAILKGRRAAPQPKEQGKK